MDTKAPTPATSTHIAAQKPSLWEVEVLRRWEEVRTHPQVQCREGTYIASKVAQWLNKRPSTHPPLQGRRWWEGSHVLSHLATLGHTVGAEGTLTHK